MPTDDVVIHCDRLDITLGIGPDIAEITDRLSKIVAAAAIRNGCAQLRSSAQRRR